MSSCNSFEVNSRDNGVRLQFRYSFAASGYATQQEWRARVEQSEVRLQWDPDHDPTCDVVERRAIQLGLRGEMLKRYAQLEVVSIQDITEFVAE
ncbi:DUF4291 family protein [Achromobacter sp. K91]|uniref:DUF4291 family protein n=1 Tax=Achromobacter sp. K91 TaxID=2292262 RepID=UPI001314C69F